MRETEVQRTAPANFRISTLLAASLATKFKSAFKASLPAPGMENYTAVRRPVVRGYLAIAFLYYIGTGILLLFLDNARLNISMTPLRVSAVCLAGFLYIWNKGTKSLGRLEITAALISLHVLVNTAANDTIDFRPENFDGFELGIILFCATSPSFRVAITLTLATIACWLSIVLTHSPNLLATNTEGAVACRAACKRYPLAG